MNVQVMLKVKYPSGREEYVGVPRDYVSLDGKYPSSQIARMTP